MKTIYLDVRYSFAISGKSGEFNGGNNYVLTLLEVLYRNTDKNYEIALICENEVGKRLRTNFPRCLYYSPDRLSKLSIADNDVLFVPQVNDSITYAKEIESFKKKYPACKIYITVHDRRDKEFLYDRYAGLLRSGWKRSAVLLAIGRKLHSLSIEKAYRKIFKCVDKVFTVSNHSLPALNNYKDIHYLNYYFVGINQSEMNDDDILDDNILFVSAGRPEKNFIRGLKAFEKFKQKFPESSIKLVATGLSSEQIERIIKKQVIQLDILQKYVVLKQYVEPDELKRLYGRCRFLLFISRNEGMGLPVAEAALFGKPAVVSWASAIPEVIGSAGLYVNPKSVDSIAHGIEVMMQPQYYNKRREFVLGKAHILRQQVELDIQIFVDEILN